MVILLIASPFLFQDKIKDLVRTTLNNSLDAEVDFADIDLSFLRSFPQAAVTVDELSIVNKGTFAGDTLFYGKSVRVDLPLSALWQDSGKPIEVNGFSVDTGVVNIHVNEAGENNYDIAKSKPDAAPADESEETAPMTFDIDSYSIDNLDLVFQDDSNNTRFVLEDINHDGSGDFSTATSQLDTETSGLVSLDYGGVNYLSRNPIAMDMKLDMDLEEQRYTIAENETTINDLPLEVNGWIDLQEESTDLDLEFHTIKSDFKNFLQLIPATYRANLDEVTTTGDFVLQGTLAGMVTDDLIPKMNITARSENASLKYGSLPNAITGIVIQASVVNDTGKLEDTRVMIPSLGFDLGSDRITGNADIRQLLTNPLVNMAVNGKLDLGAFAKAYPMPGTDLSGQFATDMRAKFDMESVEKSQYQNVQVLGNASMADFTYAGDALPQPLAIEQASLDMQQRSIKMNQFKATTGNSDFTAAGTVNNLMGFLFADQDLTGQFNVQSKTLDLADFSTTGTKPAGTTGSTQSQTSTQQGKALVIPAGIDANLGFAADRVLFDGTEFTNVSGAGLLRDQSALLNNVVLDAFDGKIAMNGIVNTKGAQPTFDLDLSMNQVNIGKSFQELGFMQKLAPIIQAMSGKLGLDLKLKGNIKDDMSLDLSTLDGTALAEILTAKLETKNTPLLNTLNSKLDFIDLENLNLKDLVANLQINDGNVDVKPFDFMVEGIKVTAGGQHSLNNEMNYSLTMDIPARYLGNSIGSAIASLSSSDLENLHVQLPIGLRGTFAAPQVNLNLQSAVSDLTRQIVEAQKDKLGDKLGDQVGGLLGGLLGGGSNKPADSTTTGTPTGTAPDSTQTGRNDAIKDAATNILGGLLGGKRKKRDSL